MEHDHPLHSENLEAGKALIEWSAPEFIAHERTERWYLLWLLGALAVIAISIIYKNILFALFTLVAAIAVLLQSQRAPRMINCAITSRGVLVGEKLHPFESLESFWIIYEPPLTKVLLIATTQWLNPQLTVQIHEENPVKIRQALISFLSEKEYKPTFIDWLISKLKL